MLQNPNKGRVRNTDGIYLILIVILGAFLRLYHLGSESLWIDEAFSFADSRPATFSWLIQNLLQPWPVNSAFYFYLLHLWSLGGESEAFLRLFSAGLGIFSVVLTFYLGKKVYNPAVGLGGAFLLAVSPFHILHSQEVRGYSLVVFLSLLALLFAVRAREDKSRANLILVFLISVLLFYTHILTILFIGGLVLFFVIGTRLETKRPARRWSLILPLLIVLFFLWRFAPPAFTSFFPRPGVMDGREAWWLTRMLGRPGLIYLIEVINSFSVGEEQGLIGGLAFRWPQLGCWVVPLFFLAGLYSAGRAQGYRRPAFWLPILISLAPVFILFGLSQFENILLPKYLIYALPVFFLTAAQGWFSIKRTSLRLAGGLLVLLVLGSSLIPYYQGQRNPDWRNALPQVFLQFQEGDVLGINPGENQAIWDYYRRQLPGAETIPAYFFGSYLGGESEITNRVREISGEYRRLAGKYRRLWLLSSLVYVNDPHNLVEQVADANFTRLQTWPGDPKVALYKFR